MRQIAERVAAELRKPASKRTIGHDRDPFGYTVLVSSLTDEEAEEARDILMESQLPAKIDCLTCRFNNRMWRGEPCWSCLEEYETDYPYPNWRRGV